MKLKQLMAMFLLIMCIGVSGCGSKNYTNENKNQIIYQESISPNEQYVDHEEDVVRYILEVYQENDETLSIHATSNSKFFEPLDYEFYIQKSFAKEDITVEWTTLMGDTDATEDNQLCIALIKIKGTDERIKINFMNRGIELIEEALGQ